MVTNNRMVGDQGIPHPDGVIDRTVEIPYVAQHIRMRYGRGATQ
jgi:hypothetical protein